MAVYLVMVLLARCGMRLSEPLRLLTTHYRSREGSFYIEKTKFRKDRLVPVSKPVKVDIDNYLSVRIAPCRSQQSGNHASEEVRQNPILLVHGQAGSLKKHYIYRAFHQAVRQVGLDQRRHELLR